MKCNVCYAWQPKEWEGYKWAYTVAKCSVHGKFTTANECCNKGSIVKPINHQQLQQPQPQEVDSVLHPHVKETAEYFSHATEIALFWEMGTGKSACALMIAADRFRRKEIDALLIIAPNGVHTQWYREQLILWLEVPYEAQCLYGRGGAKQAYPFDDFDGDILQVICVNIDTFSTPQKWKDIADWANAHKTFIVLDEATCINVSAQRKQGN